MCSGKKSDMKFLLIFLIIFPASTYAQEPVPTVGPFPTEESQVVPEVAPKEEKTGFEEVVDGPGVKVNDERPAVDEVKEKAHDVVLASRTSSDNRKNAHHTLMLGYQLLTTWIPSKIAGSYTYNFSEKWSLEGEYAKGSIGFPAGFIDLAGVSETRMTLQARRFTGNSFNFTFGAFYNSFEANVGGDIIPKLANQNKTKLGVDGIGATFGFGNRWQWQNGVTFGVDWFRINQILVQTKLNNSIVNNVNDKGARDEIKNLLSRLNSIPTFLLFGVNLGYSF